MTIRELEQIGNNWHERVHRLRAVVCDETVPTEKQQKALRLWGIMAGRVIRLGLILNEVWAQNAPKFKPGGLATKGGSNSPYVERGEFVIPRK